MITRESLAGLVQDLITYAELPPVTGIPSLRREVLPAGIVILEAIFDQLKLDKIHVADATLKDGLLYETVGRLSSEDTRHQAVAKLQNQYQIDEGQAQRVAQGALHFWRQIEGPTLPGVSRTKILTWAALLHEIGLAISHSSHHHHSYYILRHSDLAGFGRYEQYILANLVRAHRKKLTEDRFEGLDGSTQAAFLPLLVCLRLAVLLHRRREDNSFLPKLHRDGMAYVLEFPEGWLDEHPLTAAGLEKEISYLANVGILLRF